MTGRYNANLHKNGPKTVQEPFNQDRYLQRDTKSAQAEIDIQKEAFYAKGGEIKKEKAGIQSGICDLSPKAQQEIKRKLGLIK
jgi:hypothetical protein